MVLRSFFDDELIAPYTGLSVPGDCKRCDKELCHCSCSFDYGEWPGGGTLRDVVGVFDDFCEVFYMASGVFYLPDLPAVEGGVVDGVEHLAVKAHRAGVVVRACVVNPLQVIGGDFQYADDEVKGYWLMGGHVDFDNKLHFVSSIL